MCIAYFTYAVSKWSAIFRHYFLFGLFALASAATVFGTVIVPLTSLYASLLSHKLDFGSVV